MYRHRATGLYINSPRFTLQSVGWQLLFDHFCPTSHIFHAYFISSAWLCQESSWYRNSSVLCRLSSWAICIRPDVFKIFENPHFQLFKNFFFNMEPYGSVHSKTYLLLQIAFELFQTSPKFSSQWSSQKYYLGFFEMFNMLVLFVFVFLFVCFCLFVFCFVCFFFENLKFIYIGKQKKIYYLENDRS